MGIAMTKIVSAAVIPTIALANNSRNTRQAWSRICLGRFVTRWLVAMLASVFFSLLPGSNLMTIDSELAGNGV